IAPAVASVLPVEGRPFSRTSGPRRQERPPAYGPMPRAGATDMTTTPETTGSRDWLAKKVFTTGEAAEICKVSQQTIIRCFDSGRLQGFRVPGSRFRRIPRDELLRFMRENEIPTD